MDRLKISQSAALLESVMSTTDVMLVYLDTDFNFVWVNQAYADTCKMSPEEMAGKNHFALYPHAENEVIFRQVRDTGIPVFYKDKPFEFPDQPGRGVTYWDWSLSPDKGPDGQINGLVFSLRETTSYVLAQKTIQSKEADLLFAAKTAHLGYWELDIASNEFIFNDQFYDLLKTNAEREGGYRMPLETYARRFVHPDDAALVGSDTQKLMESPDPYATSELESRIICADGEVRWVWVRLMSERDAHGKVQRLKGVNLDITPVKLAELKLQEAKYQAERANQEKSRFLATMSHDLRQPVSALSLYVSILETKLPPSESKLIASIGSCVSSMKEMLSQLLDIAKLDAGVIVPNIIDTDIDEIISGVLASYEPVAEGKQIKLRYRKCGLIAHTDPVLFRRIIGNIVSNAVQYTRTGGILIACRKKRGSTWLEIWDTGIGIPADKTSEIFEEFRQLGNDERNEVKGVGLGLTIVQRLTQLLGLKINVRSRIGKGSVFAVEIPVGEKVTPVVQGAYKHKPLRIALVEDNHNVAEALEVVLTMVGHQVIVASSGSEILSKLGNAAPDIVISDYRLSGKEHGYEVIESLKSAFGSGLPALIITGDTDPVIIRSMSDKGISVMHKPLDMESLRARLAELTT